MITGDLRHAIARAVADAGFPAADPGLRPTGTPGTYASSVAFSLNDPLTGSAGDTAQAAGRLAGHLAAEPWIAAAEVTGPGFLTITVTPAALAAVPGRVIAAGPDCASSDALHGHTVDAPRDTDPLAAPSWEEARKALAAQLTVRLAAAAGATVALHGHTERVRQTPHPPAPQSPRRQPPVHPARQANPASQAAGYPGIHPSGSGAAGRVRPGSTTPEPAATSRRQDTEVARAVAFAGPDAVRFWLARAMPGRPAWPDPAIMARRVPENPAYAVRYAHARAASGMRWAASRGTATPGTAAVPWCPPADQEELALLDALSWLPERVATAARRGRPDEFARYLEELARAVLAVLPGSDRLALATAARTGLAAGLGLLGVSAPDRL